ncbi:BTAD domain-containing putative transcriptional regulator [Actinoplanes sp. NPDC026619]|uniref:BTAD domain-containing putative transcriptional regulator n=1 Tax=Actinoplanes sp. NPDC026619 TaxID=3155798 RepID=UPI0033E9E593
MALTRVTLLGAFRVSRDDTVLPVVGARLRGLLVRLALAGGRPVEPAVLIDAIWPEQPPSGAGPALQTLVSRLRRVLSADLVRQGPGGYRLAVEPADVDALRFEQLIAAGDPEALAEAVALWGDHPGAEPAVVAAVAPTVATRLAQLSVEAVTDLAAAELSRGRAGAATTRLTGLLAGHPVHERAAALLIDALAAQGRQADALARYEQTRQALAETLGTDPGAALRERHLRLLRPAPPAAPESLPASLTSFIGRDDDLDRIHTLLTTGRLVTVLGPGGAGKTRLALEAARSHHLDARFIDLAPVTEPAKIATAVLAAIGLRGGRAEGDELDVLVGELGGRESLLLVDNCEHLIDAVAQLVSGLLTRCPGLRVLATSREPLAIDGEALVPLGPLALPEPDAPADRAASVRLFVERAAAVRPGFAADEATLPGIVRVVRGLDGLPLALELAAARLRTMSLDELADRLSDRFRLLTTGSRSAPPRHRTLRAVIAWSWDLLGDDERTLAERISVLPGGVTAASARAVAPEIPPDEIPELLATLVDRSLVQLAPESGRYRMLETIREYGSGAAGPARDLAAAYFTELMSRQDPQLRGPGQPAAMRVIGADYDNTLAALRHLCATGDSAGAITLALALTWYWQMFGRHSDAAFWLAEALGVPGGAASAARDCARAAYLLNRADILSGITAGEAALDRAEMRELAGRLRTYPELPSHYRVIGPILLFLQDQPAALADFEGLAGGDDRWLAGLAHMFLAEIAGNAGELDRMRGHVEAALAGFGQAGDGWGRAAILPMRAQLRRYDDLEGALADLREARELADRFGSLSLGDQLYRDLRWIDLFLRRGDTGRALALIDSARERARHVSSAEMRVLVDVHEAGIRVRLGDLDRAADLLGFASATPHAQALAAGVRTALCLARGDLPGADKALREAHAAALETHELPVLAPVTVHAAALAEARGHRADAATLLGAAARLRGAHDRTDPQVRELTEGGRAALGEDAFAAAYAAGWELDAAAAKALLDPDQGRARSRLRGSSAT